MIPADYMSLGFIATIKALRPDGEVVFRHVTHGGLNAMEMVGMSTSLRDDLRDDLRSPDMNFSPDDSDD